MSATTARPASDFEPVMLLEAVEEVARLGKPDAPGTVAQRPWDRARALSARYADAPPARRIAEFLGLSWPEVLRIALLPHRRRGHSLGRQLGESNQDWLTDDYIAFALQLIATRLHVPTLTPAQYRAESDRLLADDARRRSHGGQLRLPNEHQVIAAAGSWDRALYLAGLARRQGQGGQLARVAPVAIIDVLDRCYEHHGVEPGFNDLARFARANGIPFPRKEAGKPWSAYVEEWKAGRQAAGLAVPAGPAPKGSGPDFSTDVGAAGPGERRGRGRWDRADELAEWVAKYLRQLPRGARASRRGYDAWASENPGAPRASTLGKHGGWSAVLAAARELLRT